MSTTKAVFAFLVLASFATNAYLLHKVWHDDDQPVIRTVVTDQPVVMRTQGGLLEVSTIKSPEHFEATKEHTILGVNVGETVTHIRVPAVYRYHIELAREWKILLRDKTFIVIAPVVKPSLPVAIDTARLEAKSFGTWSIFTGHALLEQLQQTLTQALAEKAGSSTYIQFQREAARKTVTEFVAKWLITQSQWQAATSYPVRVFFADEPIQVLGSIPPPFVAAP